MANKTNKSIKTSKMKNKVLFITTVVVVFLLGLLASSILNRKNEAKYKYVPKVKISQYEPMNEKWGENYPAEYQSFLQTIDTSFASLQDGSATRDLLHQDPRMVIMWAGYGFSKDYTQSRGHEHSIEDLRSTLRTGGPKGKGDGPMPGTCWTCKGLDVSRLMK